MLPREERLKAPLAQATHVGRARVALQESERDRTVELGEQADRPGPEPLELRPQLTSQRDPSVHEVLARTGQCAQRLRRVRVGVEHREAMAVGARQLARHERVEPVGLAARSPEPRPRGCDLLRMYRQHPQPRVQQPFDQQLVRPLDRDQLHLQSQQRAVQRTQPLLVVRERDCQQLLARLVAHSHIVLVRRPIDAGITIHISDSCAPGGAYPEPMKGPAPAGPTATTCGRPYHTGSPQ
jgi:hypothetical protein